MMLLQQTRPEQNQCHDILEHRKSYQQQGAILLIQHARNATMMKINHNQGRLTMNGTGITISIPPFTLPNACHLGAETRRRRPAHTYGKLQDCTPAGRVQERGAACGLTWTCAWPMGASESSAARPASSAHQGQWWSRTGAPGACYHQPSTPFALQFAARIPCSSIQRLT